MKPEIESAAKEAGRSAPPFVLCLDLDVTSSKSVAEAAAHVQKASPRGLDVLVNNAGFMILALPVVEVDEDV